MKLWTDWGNECHNFSYKPNQGVKHISRYFTTELKIQHSKIQKKVTRTCKRRLLTCDATVKLSATPPAFKLMRKILQSGSSVNLLMAASRAANDMLPFNWTQDTPDCNHFTMYHLDAFYMHLQNWKWQLNLPCAGSNLWDPRMTWIG